MACNGEVGQDLVTDIYNSEAKQLNSSFIDNRHDQSLFSVSRKLVGSIQLKHIEMKPQMQNPFWMTRI